MVNANIDTQSSKLLPAEMLEVGSWINENPGHRCSVRAYQYKGMDFQIHRNLDSEAKDFSLFLNRGEKLSPVLIGGISTFVAKTWKQAELKAEQVISELANCL